ncbi:hypothetical protein G6F68_017852 [Rhizopus microsporus]|nr:hypothetical protein G6F68_017852 [Rhizopus microsporus]
MPNSTTPDVFMPLHRATASSSKAATKANRNALPAISQPLGTPGSPNCKTMASDAPNAAADDTPSAQGHAHQGGHQGGRQADVPHDHAVGGVGGGGGAQGAPQVAPGQARRAYREVDQQRHENRRQQQGE